MAKRKILNRCSSRSSRYTGSGILDPDTDVIDNEYPCWWKDLENNTMVRPSINYSMLNETSRHLNSSSRIEVSKADDGWWKALDATNSSPESDNRIQRGAPKVRIASSESEEEQQVKKRKLPLRSKGKVSQKNAFFNVLNNSEDSSKKITTPDNRNKNLISNSDSNSKILMNEEQLTNTRDSRSNQSSNLNNILKSKPKIFKKNYKTQRRSIFVDALQDNEFKAPPQRRSSIMDSPIVARKNSNNMIALENQSESTEFTSFLNSVNDLSNLPAPKAQSTTLEDSTPHNSTKNSISDVEYEIVKRKPKLLRRPTKSTKRNVFENTSVAKETDKGTKRGNLTNVVENIEKSKSLKRRTRSTKRNVFEDIFAAEESDTQTETSKLSNAESVEIAKQPLIISSNDLSKSPSKLQKNDVNEDENNDTEKIRTPRSRKKRKSATVSVEKSKESVKDRLSSENVVTSKDNSGALFTQSRYDLRKSTNMDAGSESLNSPGSTMKGRNTRQRSTWDQNDINDKNDENMLNETGVSESASKGFNDEQVSNELENVNENQENIPRSRSDVNVVSSFNRKKRDSTVNRSRSLSKTSKLESLVEKEGNRITPIIIDKDAGEAEEKDSAVARNKTTNTFREMSTNVSSGSNRDKRNETENRGRSSHRASNITLPVESIGNVRTDTLNISSKNIREDESISNESSDEEIFDRKSQHADVFQKRSVSDDLRASKTMKNSNRLSSRNSNLTSSLNKIDTDRNASESEDENLNHISDEETQHQSRYVDKRRSKCDRKSANVSSRNRLSSRASKLASFTRESDGIDTDTLKIDDKTATDARNDDTSDTNNEELTSKVTRSSRSKSAANVSISFNEKERNDTGKSVRVSSRIRASNLASSQTIGHTHVSTVNDNAREVQDEVPSKSSDEQLISKVPRSPRSKSATNVSFSFNEKKHNDTGKSVRVSSRIRASNLASSQTIKDTRANIDDNAREVQDEDTSDSEEEPAIRVPRLSKKSDRAERDDTETRDKLSFKANNLMSVTKKRLENTSTNALKVNDWNLKDVEDKVPSRSSDEEVVFNASRLSRRKFNVNSSSDSDEQERERTENMVSPRTSNLVSPVKEITRNNKKVSSVLDKDGRETMEEESIRIGNEASSELHLRYSDKEQNDVSQTPVTSMSHNDNRRKRSTTKSGRSLFRTSNRLSPVKSIRNTNTRSSITNDNDERETQDEEPVANIVQRSSRRFAIDVSSSFNRKERTNTENRGRTSSRTRNSSDTNVDGKNVTETEDEAANNLETVYKKPKNVSLKKCFVNLSSEIGRKTGSDVGTGGKSSRTRNSRTSMTKTAKEKKNASNVNDTAKETEDNGNEEAPDGSQRVRKHKSLLDQILEAARKARGQRSIRPYFNIKEALKMTPANAKKMEKARAEVDKVKQQEMNSMNLQRKTQLTGKENMNERKKMVPRSRSKRTVPKAVHKAYLVNGQVYKVPRLPRPKVWVTDRLYNHLWKTMEPKYKLETRVISEKFVCRLSNVTASIAKQKSYQNYRGELYALMKEMARLGIVRTRNDFYNFCHDFFPYELRAKMVPMLLPGNKRNIPYDPSTLHTPILDS